MIIISIQFTVIWFHVFLSNNKFQIYLIIDGTTPSGLSGPGSNGNKGVPHRRLQFNIEPRTPPLRRRDLIPSAVDIVSLF